MLSQKIAPTFGLLALSLAATPSATAQEEEEVVDVTPVHCISMGRVRTTTVVDDRNILFYQRGGRIYLNILERACVGLQRNGLFTYKVQSGARHARLCDTDTINVVESNGSTGFNCGLGQFHPVSEIKAQELLDPNEAALLDKTIEIEPVELPDEEPNGDEEAAAEPE